MKKSLQDAPKRVETKGRFGRSQRFYNIEGVGLVPSSTEILKVIAKPALVNWAANEAEKAALEAAADLYADLPADAPKMIRPVYLESLKKRIGTVKAHTKTMAQAAEIGSQAHALIEWNLRKELGQKVGPEPKIVDKATWAVMVWEEWRKAVNLRPKYIEQTVWHAQRKYAGTADLIGELEFEGRMTDAVLDWKTGKAIYAEAVLQVASYAQGLVSMGHFKPGAVAVIVRLPKTDTDPEPEVRMVPWEEIVAVYPIFCAAQTLWRWADAEEEAAEKRYQAAKAAAIPNAGIMNPQGAPA